MILSIGYLAFPKMLLLNEAWLKAMQFPYSKKFAKAALLPRDGLAAVSCVRNDIGRIANGVRKG